MAIISFLFINNLSAQGWSKSYEIYPSSEITMRHAIIEDTIYLKSFCFCHNTTIQCSFISNFDTAGNLISSKEYYKPNRSIQMGGYSDIIEIENKLVTSGDDAWDNDSINRQVQHLYKISKKFDTLERIKIPVPDSVDQYGGNVLYYDKEKLIITEALRYDPKAKDKNIIHINAINENNEVIWSYNYLIPLPGYKMTDVGEIVKNSDTSFITSMRIGGSYIQYFSMNTKGKLLWEYTEKTYVDPLIGDPSTFKPMIAPADGTDIVRAWFWDNNGINANLEVSKISNTGTKKWQIKSYERYYNDSLRTPEKKIWQLIKTKNGDYVGVGGCIYNDYRKGVFNPLNYTAGYAIRIDNNGNLKWERYFIDVPKQKYGEQSFYNVAEGDDGSIYMSGTLNDSIPNKPGSTSNSNIWLVKVGPDGCITPGCNDTLVEVSTKKILNQHTELLNIYPNPGSNQVNISWKNTPSIPLKLEIRSLSGQLIQSEKIQDNGGTSTLNVSHIQSGLYLLTLHGRDWQSMPVKWVKL